MPVILDLDAFRAAPLTRDPFEFLVLPGFVRLEALPAILHDYPQIERGGSFPVEALGYGAAFAGLVAALDGPEMRRAFEEKFAIDLQDYPTTTTVRGRCTMRDGGIHTDSRSKIITVLIYLNPAWQGGGGRIRLLRSADDLDDFAAEVAPENGTLVAFRRTDHSYHGHAPFVGERRVVQFNWVTDRQVAARTSMRHRLSAWVKSLAPAPSFR